MLHEAEKLQGTAYDKRFQRRIYKRSNQQKKKNTQYQPCSLLFAPGRIQAKSTEDF